MRNTTGHFSLAVKVVSMSSSSIQVHPGYGSLAYLAISAIRQIFMTHLHQMSSQESQLNARSSSMSLVAQRATSPRIAYAWARKFAWKICCLLRSTRQTLQLYTTTESLAYRQEVHKLQLHHRQVRRTRSSRASTKMEQSTSAFSRFTWMMQTVRCLLSVGMTWIASAKTKCSRGMKSPTIATGHLNLKKLILAIRWSSQAQTTPSLIVAQVISQCPIARFSVWSTY